MTKDRCAPCKIKYTTDVSRTTEIFAYLTKCEFPNRLIDDYDYDVNHPSDIDYDDDDDVNHPSKRAWDRHQLT